MVSWSDAYNWVSSGVTSVVSTGLQYAANTVSYSLDLGKGAFNCVYSAFTHEDASRVFKDALYTFATNVLPVMLASYANDELQQGIVSYQEENPEAAMLNTGLTLLAWGLSTANLALKINRLTRAGVQNTAIRLEASSQFKKSADVLNDTDTLCKKEDSECKKNGMRYALCSAISYYVERGVLNCVIYLPGGDYLQPVVLALHDARFIMEQAMPDTCDKHLDMFRTTGLPVAIAASRYGANKLISSTVESVTGLPQEYMQKVLAEISMIGAIGAVTHMPKNVPVAGKISLPDPVDVVCKASHFGVDVVALGLTKKLPELLKDQKSVVPWGLIKQGVEFSFYHPITQKVMHIVLPAELLSMDSFVESIDHYWEGVQDKTEFIFKYIRATERSRLGQFALNQKEATQFLLKHSRLNIPKFITRLVIFLMTNDNARNTLEEYKIFIASYNVDGSIPELADKSGSRVTMKQATVDDLKKKPKVISDEQSIQALTTPNSSSMYGSKTKFGQAQFTDQKEKRMNTQQGFNQFAL